MRRKNAWIGFFLGVTVTLLLLQAYYPALIFAGKSLVVSVGGGLGVAIEILIRRFLKRNI